MKQEPLRQPDLIAFMDEKVYPALYDRLDEAFPEFGWSRKGSHWQATNETQTRTLSGSPRADRVYCYENRPFCFVIQGGPTVSWKAYLGRDFIEAARELTGRAGLSFPERERSPEELKKIERVETRRGILDAVSEISQEVLWSEKGKLVREYLKERGLSEDGIRTLGLGFYHSEGEVREGLKKRGYDLEDAQASGVLWQKLEGYILFPWADQTGRPLTLYGRWHEKTPPEDRPKTLALPNPKEDPGSPAWESTKRSPLYFDRARKAGQKDLVLVEGVLDAAVLQTRGESGVIACSGSQLSKDQAETLSRYGVNSVTICLDPDQAGESGVVSCLKLLSEKKISAYVAPTLPDGLDPDEFVLRDGLEAWRNHIEKSLSGAVWKAARILKDVSPSSLDRVKREAVHKVERFIREELRGAWSKVDALHVLDLTGERTGWPPEALEEILRAAEEAGLREAAEREFDAALRKAETDRAGGKDVLQVGRDLQAAAAALRTRTEEPPPAFSVKEIKKKLAETPEGRRSGWDTLDRNLGVRFNAGELAAIVSRPSHGKTAVLVGLLHNWLDLSEDPEDFFLLYSFEEPEAFLTKRLVSLETVKEKENSAWTPNEVQDWSRGQLSRGSDYQWPDPEVLDAAWETLRQKETRLQIVFRPSWTIEDLEAHALEVASRRKVSAVLVDYLQKINPAGGGGMSGGEDRRDIALSVIGRRLKGLAVSLGCPVVTGAQATRASGKEAGKVPTNKGYGEDSVQKALRNRRFTMQDIREGGIEQEVDLALGLLNYRVDFHEGQENAGEVPDPSRLEVGVLKYRYGEVGQWVSMAWRRKFAALRDSYPGEKL